MAKELYRVFVDETGDRGWGGSSSEIFVLSAAIVRDADVPQLVAALDAMNAELGKPTSTVLHWAANTREHPQRKMIARKLGGLPMTLSNVIVMKQSLVGSGTRLSDAASMYNYAIRRLLERVSWFVSERNGEAVVTFAHVRRFPYHKLRSYLTRLQGQQTTIVWEAFTGQPRIDQPNRVRPLQVADLAAGCLWAALRPDKFGDYETAYLREIYPLIHVRQGGKVTSYGMNIVGAAGCMDVYPWWPAFVQTCERRAA